MTKYSAQQVVDEFLADDFSYDDNGSDKSYESDHIEVRSDTENEKTDDGEDASDENNESDDESDDDEIVFGRAKNNPFKWFCKQPKLKETFSCEHHDAKLLPCVSYCETIIDFFNHLIDSNILEKILMYTNKRLLHKNKTFIGMSELKAFIGLLIVFGVTNKINEPIEEIWRKSSVYDFELAALSMSRDRFQLIASNICFDDIDTRPNRCQSKFFKFEEIFNLFRNNLSTIEPSKNLCVDEELYGFEDAVHFVSICRINLIGMG